jgi:magnesium transporter
MIIFPELFLHHKLIPMKNSDNTNYQYVDKDTYLSCGMEILIYDHEICTSERVTRIENLVKIIDKNKINLIFINSLKDVALNEELSNYFNIHQMVIEDVSSTTELPVVKESGDQLLLTMKLLDLTENSTLKQEHVSLILGDYYVIVFMESDNKIFDDIKKRIVNGKSKARQKKADYVFYLLTDCVIDTYYNIVNEIDNKIDKMEVILLEKPEDNYISHLYRIKQPMSALRGVLYSLREALLNIVQGDFALIEDETLPFLHDVKDHINNIVHMFEASRDTLSDMLEINNSNINNRLNGTMKILTIITTLFIPLTLVSGIYGMNFKYMPELSWKVGYPVALLLMLITAIIMFFIMKKNKLL